MRGPRRRVGTGIYEDAYGYEVVAAGQSKRYPPLTPISTMSRWRKERLYRHSRRRGPEKQRGTLAADAERYYAEIEGVLASWREIRAGIRAWVQLYGPLQRYRLKPTHITAARRKWLEAGVAPKTINNRVDNLRRLWRVLDGNCETPLDGIDPLTVEKEPPHLLDVDLILRVYANLLLREQRGLLRNAKTRARYMILAASGVRPSELMRAKPGDVDLERRVWRTRDGKGGYRPGGHYLYPDLFEGWELFIQANAWGKYETSAFARTLRSAGWPEGVRPYWLRSSVGIDLSDRGVDFADVSAYLGHTRVDTTRTHYVPVRGGRMQAAGERLAGRLAWHSAVAQSETAPDSSENS